MSDPSKGASVTMGLCFGLSPKEEERVVSIERQIGQILVEAGLGERRPNWIVKDDENGDRNLLLEVAIRKEPIFSMSAANLDLMSDAEILNEIRSSLSV